jgi:hypothetical protein
LYKRCLPFLRLGSGTSESTSCFGSKASRIVAFSPADVSRISIPATWRATEQRVTPRATAFEYFLTKKENDREHDQAKARGGKNRQQHEAHQKQDHGRNLQALSCRPPVGRDSFDVRQIGVDGSQGRLRFVQALGAQSIHIDRHKLGLS